jgi:hypothetical protein
MRNGFLAAACAAIMVMCSGAAQASVSGLLFQVDVSSTVNGDFSGELAFTPGGEWNLDVDGDLLDVDGTYKQSGSIITVIRASGPVQGQDQGSFIAIAIDLKQAPGTLGALARRNNVPATITGSGTGVDADSSYTFSGTQILD